jgi:hypothetical protein
VNILQNATQNVQPRKVGDFNCSNCVCHTGCEMNACDVAGLLMGSAMLFSGPRIAQHTAMKELDRVPVVPNKRSHFTMNREGLG